MDCRWMKTICGGRKDNYMDNYIYTTSSSALCCAWCGKSLGNASQVTYLNGNQPVCDLCLSRPYSTDPKYIFPATQEAMGESFK